MKKHLHKFESTLWLFIKSVFYILLLAAFIIVQRQENIGLRRLSRTMGITVFTFTIVGLLLLTVYGAYDVGRRKSKPIIYSMTLAVICTDIVTYLQVMIMRANTNIHEFRFRGLELLPITVLVQLVIIIIFVYAGNALFFLRFVTVDTFDTFSRRGSRAGQDGFAGEGRRRRAGNRQVCRESCAGGVCGLPDREVGRVLWRFPVVSPCLPGVWCRCCVRLRWHDWLTRS